MRIQRGLNLVQARGQPALALRRMVRRQRQSFAAPDVPRRGDELQIRASLIQLANQVTLRALLVPALALNAAGVGGVGRLARPAISRITMVVPQRRVAVAAT